MSTRTLVSDIRKPTRVKHTCTQTFDGTPEQVFPLMCPVREYDWVPGWSTDWVLSTSGLVEQDCMFQTPPKAGETNAAVWIVTRHEPEDYRVEMYKVTPGFTIGKLEISLADEGTAETGARISYEFTSLGPDGDTFLEGFTAEWYENFMRGWQAAINHFLNTGESLAPLS